jgi:hypothetical protein
MTEDHPESDEVASELLERAEQFAEENDIAVEDVDFDEVASEADDDHRFREWRSE